MNEVVDDVTGISNRQVVDWKQQKDGSDLRPRVTIRDEKGEVLTLSNGLEARYFLKLLSHKLFLESPPLNRSTQFYQRLR